MNAAPPRVAPEIFRAYDIRGRVGGGLDPETMRWLGRAVGSEARARGWSQMVVGRDGRLSSPELAAALVQGLMASGLAVLDIGLVTTPMAYFAAYELDAHCACMVTGSHNPLDYNGLKIVLGDEALSGEAIQGLRRRIETGDLVSGAGGFQTRDIRQAYFDRIVGDIRLARPMKIVLDCGNGAAGLVAPELFRALGCQVETLYGQVDGRFPHHHPDPSQPDNLRDLAGRLRAGDAEIGLAFDGDADRLGVVGKDGRIVYPDRLLMLFAADVLARQPGATVIYDVKCTRHLRPWIEARGGRPLMWKSGHSLIKAKMRETGAPLAAELSGHIFFGERWYGFDDGVYAGARLLECLSGQPDTQSLLAELPDSPATPERYVPVPEGTAHRKLAELARHARFEGAEVNTLDGLRIEFPDGFGLVRASNTTPALALRFEGMNGAALRRIERSILELLKNLDGS